MPLLTIHHKTEYSYANPVSFGEHRVMLRPRDGHDLRVLHRTLAITPQPSALRWIHDVFGNSVGIAKFEGPSDRLVFESVVKIEHYPTSGLELAEGDHAYLYPFAYDGEEMPDLARSVERQHADPDSKVEDWARSFVDPHAPTRTQDLLAEITHAIKKQFRYRRRTDPGVQEPLETLRIGSGTCRDFALFMIEAVRALGFAARFVTGYLHIRNDGPDGHVGGGNTHAWVQVYLPGAGWVEFDPTNGIVGNQDLIRVAVAREPRQAIPLWGTYFGAPSDHLDMNVEIKIVPEPEAKAA